MTSPEFKREQEELCIKYAIKKYADEIYQEETEAAKHMEAPQDPRRERAMERKVLGRRKHWRKVVLVAVLVAGLTLASLSAGAFGDLWKWLSVQVSNTFIRFEDTAAEICTEDGAPAEEVYAQLAAECPDVGMVVPRWVPEGTVLKVYNFEPLAERLDLLYEFNEGNLRILHQTAAMYKPTDRYPLEENTYDTTPIEVMGQQATCIEIINELGEHVYTVSWRNDNTATYYNVRVVTKDVEIFRKIMDGLKNYI